MEDAERNVIQSIHGGYGDVEAALAASATTVSGEWRTSRVSHAQLETHGSIGWLDDDGRLVIRTSSQVPFLTRDALCALFDLPQERVRVFTARVGGGFGGKQEMYTEDLVALAVLRTGRPGGVRDEPHRRVPAHRGAASDAGEGRARRERRTACSPR